MLHPVANGSTHPPRPARPVQIHHALCDMLNHVLLPLVRSDAPQQAARLLGDAALAPWCVRLPALLPAAMQPRLPCGTHGE